MAIKQPPQLNGTQTADMAFIMVCFFMMVTTMGSEFGMIRQLPPWTDESQGDLINERNVLLVFVNQHNSLMVRGEIIEISDLRKKTKDFYDLSKTSDKDPEK